MIQLLMIRLSTKFQVTTMKEVIGRRSTFNNEKNSEPYVKYNRPQHGKRETIKTRKLTA